jgi:hypothetical protein
MKQVTAVLAVLAVAAATVPGAATSPSFPSLPLAKLCKKSGIRYSGKTAQGGAVCFTLTPSRKALQEIGYTFVARDRCPAHATGSVTADFVDRPWKVRGGRIDVPGGPGSFFRGRIAGYAASGVLADRDICRGRVVKWTAYRPSLPANTSSPTISGTPQVGQTLTAGPGTWTGTPAPTFTYQWQRCDASAANCVAIPVATAQVYTLNASDVGSTIRVAVTATNTVGLVTAVSSATAVVVM